MIASIFCFYGRVAVVAVYILCYMATGGAIDLRSTEEAMAAMQGNDAAKKQSAVEMVKKHSENYAPPALFGLSKSLFEAGKKDDAMFWFYAGQLRARYDANRCADVSARGATTILTENYGPPINQYAFEHKKKLKATILKVVEWDRRTPHKYDHRWINLHEMGAVIDALDAEDGRKTSRQRTSLPKDQWNKIAEQTRQTYLEDFLEVLSPTGLGSPTRFFKDAKVAALVEAAEEGNIGELDRLAAAGADVNTRGKYGVTPLLWALWARNKDGFRRLLEHRADPDCETDDTPSDNEALNMNRETQSAIEFAAGLPDDSEWLEMLLKHHANVNHPRRATGNVADVSAGETPIFDAVAATNIENLDMLIRAGADLNHQNRLGNTPMIHAVQYGGGSFQIVYRLLEAGADYRIRNKGGQDIAFVSLCWGGDPNSEQGQCRKKVLALLEKKGADLKTARETLAQRPTPRRRDDADDDEGHMESWPTSPRPWPEDKASEPGIQKETPPVPSQSLQESAKTLFAEATAVAQQIKDDPHTKDVVLEQIATAQGAATPSRRNSAGRGPLDQNRIVDIVSADIKAGRFADALAMADSIKEKDQQLRVLRGVAVAQANAGLRAQARNTLAHMTTIAGTIADKTRLPSATCDIAIVQHSVGLEKEAAKTLANLMAMLPTTGEKRDDAIGWIPVELADAGIFPEAVAAAGRIANPFDRAMRLKSIAVTQAKAGQREHARETFRKATAAALKMGDAPSDRDYKIHELCEIARAEAKAGFADPARQTCMAAKSADGGTGVFLCQVATTQAYAGYFAAALATTRNIREAEDKADALLGIAVRLSNRIAPDQARLIFAEAIAVARRLTNDKQQRLRDKRLCRIIKEMAGVGLFDEARVAVCNINVKMFAAQAIYEIAIAQADAGLTDQSRRTFNDAAAAAQHEKVEDFFSLSDIAQQQAAAGFHNDARATVALIHNPFYKFSALGQIVAEPPPAMLSAGGRRKYFRDLLAEIQRIPCKEEDMQEKRNAMQAVANSQAKAGLFADALATARSIEDPLDKAATLRDITERQANAGFLIDALFAARSIQEPALKARAICAVAVARTRQASR